MKKFRDPPRINPSFVQPGMLLTTVAGNQIMRMERPIHDQPHWAISSNDVLWEATLLFDSSCSTATPASCQTLVSSLIVFDALRLGLLWDQVVILNQELAAWSRT